VLQVVQVVQVEQVVKVVALSLHLLHEEEVEVEEPVPVVPLAGKELQVPIKFQHPDIRLFFVQNCLKNTAQQQKN
jgi:hypothetical protein